MHFIYDNMYPRWAHDSVGVAPDMRSFPGAVRSIQYRSWRSVELAAHSCSASPFNTCCAHEPPRNIGHTETPSCFSNILSRTLTIMGTTVGFHARAFTLSMNTQIAPWNWPICRARRKIVEQKWTVSSRMQEADWNLPMPSYMFHITGTTVGFNIKAPTDSGWRVQSGGITV